MGSTCNFPSKSNVLSSTYRQQTLATMRAIQKFFPDGAETSQQSHPLSPRHSIETMDPKEEALKELHNNLATVSVELDSQTSGT